MVKNSSVTKWKYIFAVIVFFIVLLLVKIYFSHKQPPEVVQPPKEVKEKRDAKLILIYNTLWGNRLWPGFETTDKWNNWGGLPCKVQDCRLTYNKKLLSKADVVLFHAFGDDMLTRRELMKLQKQRNPDSYWIYFLHECPHNARPDPSLYDGLFNWTMGYRQDADIVVPYNWEWGTWEERAPEDPVPVLKNHAEEKDRLVWSGISHCGCMREHYIKKLMEYINVDVFGQCAKRFYEKENPPECPRGLPECTKRLKRYKFYLAFENSFCEDYISEKFSETILDGNAVPIVMGGADYKNLGLHNSFIDVNDFDTIEDLASFLKYLDENDSAYNKHFEYKRKFKLGKPRSWSCKICELINSKDLKPKRYEKLGDWYSVKNTCGTRLERVREIMDKSGVPHPYTDEYYHYDY